MASEIITKTINKELLSIITKTCLNIFIVAQVTLVIIFPLQEAAQFLQYSCIFLGISGCLSGILMNDWAVRILGLAILSLCLLEIFGFAITIILQIPLGFIFGHIDYLIQENERRKT